MTAVQTIIDLDPAAWALLSDMKMAPRQFLERFLDQEGLTALTLDDLLDMPLADLDAMTHRWRMVGVAPSRQAGDRVVSPRPVYLDKDSANEMLRGFFLE